MATAAKKTTTTKASEPETYLDKARALAADARALAEKTRQELAALDERVADLGRQEFEPTAYQAASSARRLPMSTQDIGRALNSLVAAANDLAAQCDAAS